MNRILWITHSEAAWRDLPERYGAWQTVYKRFLQWQEAGLLERIFHDLRADADLQDISIDSTYIKAHKASAGAAKKGESDPQNQRQNECIGVSRGGRSTKVYAIVDALGNPIHVQLSAGNVHDVAVAEELLHQALISGSTVLADKAYGAGRLRENITQHNADYCIPSKFNEPETWFCDW